MTKYKFIIPILIVDIFLLFHIFYPILNSSKGVDDGLGIYLTMIGILFICFNFFGALLAYFFSKSNGIISYMLYIFFIFGPIVLIFYQGMDLLVFLF